MYSTLGTLIAIRSTTSLMVLVRMGNWNDHALLEAPKIECRERRQGFDVDRCAVQRAGRDPPASTRVCVGLALSGRYCRSICARSLRRGGEEN